jgi:inhibitor of KinA sporulation pathway (predicted exonuclease)
MNYLVTDLESTCSEKNEIPREDMEIIEIGAVLLNEKLEIIDTFSCFVKPIKHTTLTSFCKNLTKIKQSDTDQAENLDRCLTLFSEWAIKHGEYTFTSWGAFDYNQINRECYAKNIKNPILQNNLNYKKVFAKIYNLKNKRGVGLRKALNILNLNFEGIPHRAIYDAKNIAKIIQKCGFK